MEKNNRYIYGAIDVAIESYKTVKRKIKLTDDLYEKLSETNFCICASGKRFKNCFGR